MRRQLLMDMGIVPWRLRATAAAAGCERAAPDAAEPPATGAARMATLAPPPAEPSDVRPVAPGLAAPAEPDVQAWSAVSLCAGGVVLLVPGDAARRDLRLAMDVLAAACGDWRQRPASRRFDWPPEGLERVGGTAGAAQRALAAFVDKDLGDHAARLLLCTADLAPRLGPVAACRPRVIPSLDELGRSVEAKRTLWQTLREPNG